MNEWIWQSDGDDRVRQKESEKSFNASVHWQMNGADFWIEMEEEKINKLTI